MHSLFWLLTEALVFALLMLMYCIGRFEGRKQTEKKYEWVEGLSSFGKEYTFHAYEKDVRKFARYPHIGSNLVYPALGLTGEAGELSEKIKKLWRNEGLMSAIHADAETKKAIRAEAGDCLWYLSAIARELGISLADIANANFIKLDDRARRDVLKGEGDNR